LGIRENGILTPKTLRQGGTKKLRNIFWGAEKIFFRKNQRPRRVVAFAQLFYQLFPGHFRVRPVYVL
jgi:hypothetical protein